jgi:hypothetical protein
MASRIFVKASSRVLPWEIQPGKLGHSATKMPSSSSAISTRNRRVMDEVYPFCDGRFHMRSASDRMLEKLPSLATASRKYFRKKADFSSGASVSARLAHFARRLISHENPLQIVLLSWSCTILVLVEKLCSTCERCTRSSNTFRLQGARQSATIPRCRDGRCVGW